MTLQDAYGNTLSTANSAARDQYDVGVALFLGGNRGASDAFASACKIDPGFALGHAAFARALMMEGRMPEARTTLDQANVLSKFGSDRERTHIAAYKALLEGDTPKCRNIVHSHEAEYPRDPMMMQLLTNVFGLIGFSGKVGREEDLLAFTTQLMPHYQDDWWMMSMHAASLCETGHLVEAMRFLDGSFEINPKNAHAAHFIAHTRYEAGETKEGRHFLTEWMQNHDSQGVLHGHLSWHSALWALRDGDEPAIWSAIDQCVWPNGSSSLPINVLTDSASILYRAELAGVTVPRKRWRALSDYAAQFFPDTGQSFADVHAALCHAMAGEGERLAYIAESAKGFAGDLVAPVARAWAHIAHENWQDACECLSEVMGTHHRLGGSRAQRDLIELTYANVLMKLGRAQEAHLSLKTRRPNLTAREYARVA